MSVGQADRWLPHGSTPDQDDDRLNVRNGQMGRSLEGLPHFDRKHGLACKPAPYHGIHIGCLSFGLYVVQSPLFLTSGTGKDRSIRPASNEASTDVTLYVIYHQRAPQPRLSYSMEFSDTPWSIRYLCNLPPALCWMGRNASLSPPIDLRG